MPTGALRLAPARDYADYAPRVEGASLHVLPGNAGPRIAGFDRLTGSGFTDGHARSSSGRWHDTGHSTRRKSSNEFPWDVEVATLTRPDGLLVAHGESLVVGGKRQYLIGDRQVLKM
jgi:hypothetical protein